MLLAALTALVVSVGGALGGESELVMALLVAGVMNLGAYWFSDRIVLRMHGAQPLTEVEAPEQYAHELAHIRNRDTLVMTVAATLAGAVSMLANLAQWSPLFGGRSNDDGEATPNPLAGLVGILVAPLAAALIQKRCRGCGFTVRCAVALASPGGPTAPGYRRVAMAVTGDSGRLSRRGSGFRWRHRSEAAGQWRRRAEQRWTEMSIKAVPDPWADR